MGARGVMQILPKTAREEFGIKARDLWDPRLNIKVGIMYLYLLYNQYGERWDLALSHYNGGSLYKKGGVYRIHRYTRGYVRSVYYWWKNCKRLESS